VSSDELGTQSQPQTLALLKWAQARFRAASKRAAPSALWKGNRRSLTFDP